MKKLFVIMSILLISLSAQTQVVRDTNIPNATFEKLLVESLTAEHITKTPITEDDGSKVVMNTYAVPSYYTPKDIRDHVQVFTHMFSKMTLKVNWMLVPYTNTYTCVIENKTKGEEQKRMTIGYSHPEGLPLLLFITY